MELDPGHGGSGSGAPGLLIEGFETHSPSGSTITAQAETLGTSVGDIDNFDSRLTTTHNNATEGLAGIIAEDLADAPATARNQAREVVQGTTVAAGALTVYGTAIDTYNTSVARWNTTIGSRQTAEDQREAKGQLTPQYHTAVEDLETAARTCKKHLEDPLNPTHIKTLFLSGALPVTTPAIFGNLDLGLTDDELTEGTKAAIEAMTPEEQAAYVRDHPAIDPEIVEVISPAAQDILAEEVVDDIENPENIDEETVRLLHLFKNERAFTDYLYDDEKGVTPNEMGDAILQLNYDLFGVGEDRDGDQFNGTAQDNLDLYNGFMNAAGVGLATYTRNHPSPSSLADDWSRAITDDDNPENAAALTLLMREGGESGGTFDATFIDHVASDVYRWERDHDGDPVWGPKAREAGVWIRDPDRVTINEYTDGYGYDHYSFDGGVVTDGMANLLGAMGNSPEGAQRFFMNSDGSVDEDRLDYLLTERTFSEVHDSDEGDGLGEALKAAIVGGLGENPGDWNSTEADALATDVFTTIAEHSGTGDGFGPDDTWHIWPDMADDLGVIGAGYRDDIYDIVDGGSPDRLDISSGDLDKVLGEIGRGDKTGIETLSAAIMIEGNDRIHDAIEQWKEDHPGEPVTMDALADSGLGLALQGRGATNGEVLGHILNKSVLVDLDDEELEKTRAAYVSKAVDIAGGFIPGAGSVLGQGAGHLATSSYDLAKGQGLDLLKQTVGTAPDASADQYRQQSRDATEQALEYNTINQLIRAGYLGDQNPGGDEQPGIPSSLLVDGPDGTQVVNPDLYDADGIEEIGKEGDYTAAQIEQMRRDWNAWLDPTNNVRNITEGIVSQAQDGFDREVNKGP